MGVTFDELKNVSWSTYPSGLDNMTNASILAWIYATSWNAGGVSTIVTRVDGVNSTFFALRPDSSGNLRLNIRRDTSAPSNLGQWHATPAMSTNTLYHVAMTMDLMGTTAPLLYVNGISQTVVTDIAVSAGGAMPNSGAIRVASATAGLGFIGHIYSALVYGRILSAQEILDAYNSRLAIPTLWSLIWAPQLWGNAGNVGEGGTLAAGNTVADYISGALGVPSGSPLFRQDTYLNYKECF